MSDYYEQLMKNQFTIVDPDNKTDYFMTFHREGKTIGKLDFTSDKMVFTGEAEENAEVFFDFVASFLERRFALERAAERSRCIDIIENYKIHVGGSSAGEIACEMTYSALRDIRDEINGVKSE